MQYINDYAGRVAFTVIVPDKAVEGMSPIMSLSNVNYSGNGQADYQLYDVHYVPKGMTFRMDIDGQQQEFYLPVFGLHNILNAAFAIAISNGQVIAKKAGTGRVRAEEIDAVIGNYIDPFSLLCTDTASNYKKFAVIKELKHETINLSKEGYVKKGIYHLQHVNSYHRRLKEWMQRFQGVATKYLDNYLYWFNSSQIFVFYIET